MANLLRGLPSRLADEQCLDLLTRPGLRIEQIISIGQATPAGHWLDQAWEEWVLLVKGAARLTLEGEPTLELHPGDHVLIGAHRRHRVDWTSPDGPTVWLAVHFDQT